MKNYPIIDLHEDLLLAENDTEHGTHDQTNIAMLEQSPVRVALVTGFTDIEDLHAPEANDWLARDLATYIELEQTNQKWKLIRSNVDLLEVMEDASKQGIIFHIEGLNAINSYSEFSLLEEWYTQGLRSIGPVWNASNAFGGGAEDPITGLTKLGNELLMWCEEHNVIVDFAHMNRATFWDALNQVSRPPLVSHTAASNIFDSPRNLNDEQIRAVAERDGVIGIFCSRKFTAPMDERGMFKLNRVLDHLQHLVHIGGHDHVALGSDYGGALSGTPVDAPSVNHLDVFVHELELRGWSDDQLEKVFYKNALRVLSAHLG